MTPKSIEGSEVIKTFTILYNGWETDNEGWITKDGRVWTTSHGGSPYEMSTEQVKEKIEEANLSLMGLIDALTAKTFKHSYDTYYRDLIMKDMKES